MKLGATFLPHIFVQALVENVRMDAMNPWLYCPAIVWLQVYLSPEPCMDYGMVQIVYSSKPASFGPFCSIQCTVSCCIDGRMTDEESGPLLKHCFMWCFPLLFFFPDWCLCICAAPVCRLSQRIIDIHGEQIDIASYFILVFFKYISAYLNIFINSHQHFNNKVNIL